MNLVRSRISRAMFSLAVAGAMGFGATQAFATPAAPAAPAAAAFNCEQCAMQCAVIRLCYPGYCQCG